MKRLINIIIYIFAAIGVFVTIIALWFFSSIDDWYVQDRLGKGYLLIVDNTNYVVINYKDHEHERTIIPPKIVEYGYDDRWILAKSYDRYVDSTTYWIIDKELKPNFSEGDLSVVYGPLDSIQFQSKKKEYSILVSLKPVGQ
jgi:hypothetical protein